MRKPILIIVGSLVAATSFAPAAYARHRHIHAVVVAPAANPRIDQYGQFYALPMQSGEPTDPGYGIVPGLGLAGGVVGGVTQPLLAPAGLGVIPGLDAAGSIVNGVTQPLLAPLS